MVLARTKKQNRSFGEQQLKEDFITEDLNEYSNAVINIHLKELRAGYCLSTAINQYTEISELHCGHS
jgi:hypothetical protein